MRMGWATCLLEMIPGQDKYEHRGKDVLHSNPKSKIPSRVL